MTPSGSRVCLFRSMAWPSRSCRPCYGNRNVGETLIALAKNLGGTVQEALAFENMEAVVKQTAKAVLRAKKGSWPTVRYPNPENTLPLRLNPLISSGRGWSNRGPGIIWMGWGKGGKADLFPAVLGQEPEKMDLSYSLYGPEGKEIPLLLVPHSLMMLQTGYFPNPPHMTKMLGEETLQGNDLMAQIAPGNGQEAGPAGGPTGASALRTGGNHGPGPVLRRGQSPGCISFPWGWDTPPSIRP